MEHCDSGEALILFGLMHFINIYEIEHLKHAFFISCKAADCKVAIFSFYIHFKGYITLPILQLVTLAMFFMLNWYIF